MKKTPICRFTVLTLLVLVPDAVIATDPWIGQKVFWKSGARARIGEAAIHIEKVPFPAKVERVEGDWVWLGRAWVPKEDVMSADEALAYYSHKIDFNPINDTWWRRRSSIWPEKGEYRNALQDCNDAIRLDPKNSSAYNHRGMANLHLGDEKNAMADFNEAIDADPKNANAFQNRGKLFLRQGKFGLAVDDFSEAFRIDPYDSTAYLNRGIAWNQSGNFPRALTDFKQAIQVDSTSAEAYSALASVQASCPDDAHRDGNSAIRNAEKACEISGWKNWIYLGVLAAAYAEIGDFESAIKWQEQSVDLATADNDKLEAFERLQIFRNFKPLRLNPASK